MDGFTENSKLPFLAEDYHQLIISPSSSSSSMNLFHQNPHAHFSNNNLYPVFSSTIDKFNELHQKETTHHEKADYSFTPCQEEEEDGVFSSGDDYYSYCDDVAAAAETCCAKSDTDSCSQVVEEDDDQNDDDDDEEEVSLDELLKKNGKAKKKMEVLAEMVGADSTEPVIVLTEVVRVLKQLRRMSQF